MLESYNLLKLFLLHFKKLTQIYPVTIKLIIHLITKMHWIKRKKNPHQLNDEDLKESETGSD